MKYCEYAPWFLGVIYWYSTVHISSVCGVLYHLEIYHYIVFEDYSKIAALGTTHVLGTSQPKKDISLVFSETKLFM
jgi:hypothetical protein